MLKRLTQLHAAYALAGQRSKRTQPQKSPPESVNFLPEFATKGVMA